MNPIRWETATMVETAYVKVLIDWRCGCVYYVMPDGSVIVYPPPTARRVA